MELVIAAMAIVLAASGFAAWRWHRTRQAQSAEKFVLTRLTNKDVDDSVTAVCLSPDGKEMVYADADGVEVQTIGMETSRLLQTPPMREIDRVEWMDGGHVLMSGTAAQPEIWLLSLLGEPPQLFRRGARQGVPNRQNDDVAFLDATNSEVWIAGPHGQEAHKVFTGQPQDTFPLILWSLNGKTLLLQRHRRVVQSSDPADASGPGYQAAYLAVNAATGKVTAEKDEVFFSAAALTLDGHLLMTQVGGYPVMAQTRTLTVAVDPRTGAFRGDPTLVTEVGEAGLVEMSSAAQSDVIAAVRQLDPLPKIYVGDLRYPGPALENVHLLTFDRSEDYTHGWLRDSSAVLFESKRDGRFQIFEQPLNRHDANALTQTHQQEAFARATPDGRWILFAARKEGSSDVMNENLFQLYRIPVRGGTAVQIPTGGTAGQFRCALTVDLCLLRDRDRFGRIAYYRLDPISGRGAELYSTQATAGDLGGDWDLSPDGTTLAVLPTGTTSTIRTIRSGPGGIYVKVDDLPVRLTSTLTDLNWAADGSGWIVGARSDMSTDLLFVDRTGRAVLLRHTQGESWGTPSPDGRRLAFVNHVVDSNVWLLRKQP